MTEIIGDPDHAAIDAGLAGLEEPLRSFAVFYGFAETAGYADRQTRQLGRAVLRAADIVEVPELSAYHSDEELAKSGHLVVAVVAGTEPPYDDESVAFDIANLYHTVGSWQQLGSPQVSGINRRGASQLAGFANWATAGKVAPLAVTHPPVSQSADTPPTAESASIRPADLFVHIRLGEDKLRLVTSETFRLFAIANGVSPSGTVFYAKLFSSLASLLDDRYGHFDTPVSASRINQDLAFLGHRRNARGRNITAPIWGISPAQFVRLVAAAADSKTVADRLVGYSAKSATMLAAYSEAIRQALTQGQR